MGRGEVKLIPENVAILLVIEWTLVKASKRLTILRTSLLRFSYAKDIFAYEFPYWGLNFK